MGEKEKEGMIFVINGISECGKDTFMSLIEESFDVRIFSTITRIREGVKFFGVKGKSDRERLVYNLVKKILIWYNDYPFKMTAAEVLTSPGEIKFIVCREPGEIKKFLDFFPGTETILIKPCGEFAPKMKKGDEKVYSFNYDHVILNSGRMLDFKLKVGEFVNAHIRKNIK